MKRRKEGKSNGNLPLQIPINNGSTNRMGKTCKGLKNVLRHFRVFFPLQACRVYILVPFFCTKADHKHIVQTSVVERIYELCLDWLLKLLKHET